MVYVKTESVIYSLKVPQESQMSLYVHRAITKPHFMEVFDLSDHPMLVDVNTVLKQSSGEKYVM